MSPFFFNTLHRFMIPQTSFGKSLRDAFLAGIIAFVTVFTETDFGQFTPVASAMGMFLLARINRFVRGYMPTPSEKNTFSQ